jgi:hypothetical protein
VISLANLIFSVPIPYCFVALIRCPLLRDKSRNMFSDPRFCVRIWVPVRVRVRVSVLVRILAVAKVRVRVRVRVTI